MALPVLAAGATAVAGKVGTKLFSPQVIANAHKAIMAGKGKYGKGSYDVINGMLRKKGYIPLKKK